MKRFDALDILKYIACFFVVAVHMDIPPVLQSIMQPLLRVAVPIFFMITGFFYSNVVRAGKIEKQLKKIAVFVVAANAVHIGWYCVKCLIGDESLAEFAAQTVKPTSLIQLLVFNQPIWRTSLWYINALLVVLLVFYTVRKREDYHGFYPLIPVLLAVNLLLSTYSFVLPFNEQLLLCYSRNFLFCGVPFFLLGMYVHDHRQRVCNIFGKWYCTILFWGMGCLELWLLQRFNVLYHQDLLLTGSFLALSLFALCVKEECRVGAVGKRIAAWGAKHSFVIYVSHSIIIEILYKIVNKADEYIPFAAELFSWFGPLVVLALSTLLATALAFLKQRKRSTKT